jgi:hypothetical protein
VGRRGVVHSRRTVWEAIEGALTDDDTELFWVVFGNLTRNTGRFRECLAGGRFAHRFGGMCHYGARTFPVNLPLP